MSMRQKIDVYVLWKPRRADGCDRWVATTNDPPIVQQRADMVYDPDSGRITKNRMGPTGPVDEVCR